MCSSVDPTFTSPEFTFLKSVTSVTHLLSCVLPSHFDLIWLMFKLHSKVVFFGQCVLLFPCLNLIFYFRLISVGSMQKIFVWSLVATSHSVKGACLLLPLSYTTSYQFINIYSLSFLAFIFLPLDTFASHLPSSSFHHREAWNYYTCAFCTNRTIHLSFLCLNQSEL